MVGPGLWERYDTGDNLVFTEDDFRAPASSGTMKELWRTDHPAVQAFVGRLAVSCTRPIPQTPWLDQIAPEGEPVPLTHEERRQAALALGLSLPVPIEVPAGAIGSRHPAPLSLSEEDSLVDADGAGRSRRGRNARASYCSRWVVHSSSRSLPWLPP